MIIREIAETELEEWLKMRGSLWPGHNHLPDISRYFQGECSEPALVMVGISDNGVVMGHIELSVRLDPEKNTHGFIEGLYIKSEFREGDTLREFIRTALSWSTNNGFASVLADRGSRLYEIPHSGPPRIVSRNITDEELHRHYPLEIRSRNE